MKWRLDLRTLDCIDVPDGRVEFVCEHGAGHSPCWSHDRVHGCCEKSCCKRDDFPGRPPQAGDLAFCGAGRLGLIIHPEHQTVVYEDGNEAQAWIGLTLPGCEHWSSRSPCVIGNISDILDLRASLAHYLGSRLVEGWRWTNKP